MRLLSRALVLLGGLLTALALVAVVLLWRTLPADPDTLEVAGIEAPIQIRFDARGRPWVESASAADAMFAQGWLHARDRLWQMELLRRAGKARLAEALGSSLVATDAELLRAGVVQLGQSLAAHAGAETNALVTAYVAGINARLEGARGGAPELLLLGITPAPWRPEDVFAVGALMAWDSARNHRNELLRAALAARLDPERMAALLPDDAALPGLPWVLPDERSARAAAGDPGLPDAASWLDALAVGEQGDTVYPRRPRLSLGSNGWVLAPERSRSGHALFAFDSHDGWTMPALLYEVHHFHDSPDGPRQLRGWTAPGLPGVINGFNDRAAWGLTSIGDSQDLFLETRDPEDPLRFLGRDGWYRAQLREERIPVAGGGSETVRIITTENGPLIHEDPPLSLAWTGHHLEGFSLDGLLALNRARTHAEFEAAALGFAAPSTHATWADVSGRIASRVLGVLPERGAGQGLVPLSAAAEDSAWRGLQPLADLPAAVDPPQGFIAAANSRVNAPGAGPLVSADNAPGYRKRRIDQQLEGTGRLDLDAMQALQTDFGNVQAQLLLPALLSVLDRGALAAPASEALALIEQWRSAPVNAADSAAALVFAQWYIELVDALFGEALGPDLLRAFKGASYPLDHAMERLLRVDTESPWWRGDRQRIVTSAFTGAVTTLTERLGGRPGDWRWDALHRVRFRHELSGALPLLDRLLDRGPWPWGGGNPTPGRARYDYNAPFEARGGASVRVVIEMSRPMQVRAVIAGGQSGHFLSEHYDDQFGTWLAGELEVLPERPELAGPVVTRLLPSP